MSSDDVDTGPFTDEEVSDLRELLDQIEQVSSEDGVASLIEYNGEKVILAKPVYVEPEIVEALEREGEEVRSS